MEKRELLDRYRKLYTAVISDALDDIGLWSQVLSVTIQPLFANTPKICGFAHTLKARPSEKLGSWLPNTFKRWTQGYDNATHENILVICCSSPVGAVWGSLRTERMLKVGCKGIVTNGFIRDTCEIEKTGFPIYASGRKPSDCRGRIEYEDHNCLVTIGKVAIRPGDLLLADDDGIMVVPSDAAEEVLKLAEKLDQKHEWIHSQLKAGRPASEVMETYSREVLRSQSES